MHEAPNSAIVRNRWALVASAAHHLQQHLATLLLTLLLTFLLTFILTSPTAPHTVQNSFHFFLLPLQKQPPNRLPCLSFLLFGFLL